MRIVSISDTHGLHSKVVLPGGDLLVHAGDFSNIGDLKDTERFLYWFSQQPHPYKICIAGNHDFLPYNNKHIFYDILKSYPGIIYLYDSFVTIDGVKIYGSPWSPAFNDWAFMLDSQDIKLAWDKIPKGVDILLTHCPPNGVLDKVFNLKKDEYDSLGCESLLNAVTQIKPKVHIFGHLHENYGIENHDNTIFVNASLLDDNYALINGPVVINVDFKSKRRT